MNAALTFRRAVLRRILPREFICWVCKIIDVCEVKVAEGGSNELVISDFIIVKLIFAGC